jgi:hypothetical protein
VIPDYRRDLSSNVIGKRDLSNWGCNLRQSRLRMGAAASLTDHEERGVTAAV